MTDQEEGMGIWLTTIIFVCLIFALVTLFFKEIPDLLASLTSTVEEIKMEILLKSLG
jgi:hypothetical protein